MTNFKYGTLVYKSNKYRIISKFVQLAATRKLGGGGGHREQFNNLFYAEFE